MNWKDTVMGDEQLYNCFDTYDELDERLEKVAKSQAKISFNAGYAARETEWDDAVLARGKREGIRIVVEWIEKQGNDDGKLHAIYSFTGDYWQAKLKEWGVK